MFTSCSFSLFFHDYIKQDAFITATRSKRIIELLNNQHKYFLILIQSWNLHMFALSTTNLPLGNVLPILSQAYYIIIVYDFSKQVHGREVVDGLNTYDKMFLSQFMATVKYLVLKGM